MNIQELTADWLSHRLERAVAAVDVQETFKSQLAEFFPLQVRFADGTSQQFLFKQYCPEGIEWGLKEKGFYDHCAAKMKEPIYAQCFGCGVDDADRTTWFLLQDLRATHEPHDEETSEQEIQQAIPPLVALHSRWWEDEVLLLDELQQPRQGACRMANACSPDNIRLQASHWLQHELPRSRQEIGATFTDAMIDVCTRAIKEWPDLLVARIGDGSQMTVIHGDAHLDNLYFPRDPTAYDAVLVDWETWERGIPAYDLAYLLSFHTELEEEAMSLYFDQLTNTGITGYSWERFVHDYRLSVICCLFPPIQWMRSWGGVWVLQKALDRFEQWNCAELLVNEF